MAHTTKTAFVFAGGSSLGSIQVGMLKALLAHRIHADFVVGSSAGAINAAYFATEPTLDGVLKLATIWRNTRRRDIFPISPIASFMALFRRRGYLLDPAALTRYLRRHMRIENLEDTKIPCHVVATDQFEGSELRMCAGPLIPALLASAAIPGVFPPVMINGRSAVDGGLANHTPISIAVELGATRIFVLPTAHSSQLDAPPGRAITAALHGLNILMSHQLTEAVHRYGKQVNIQLIPPLRPRGASPYDFAAADRMIDNAEQSTAAWLEKSVETINSTPRPLRPSRPHAPQPSGPAGSPAVLAV